MVSFRERLAVQSILASMICTTMRSLCFGFVETSVRINCDLKLAGKSTKLTRCFSGLDDLMGEAAVAPRVLAVDVSTDCTGNTGM